MSCVSLAPRSTWARKNDMNHEKWSAVPQCTWNLVLLAVLDCLKNSLGFIISQQNTRKVTVHFPTPGILPQLLPAPPVWLLVALGSDPSAPPQKTMLRSTECCNFVDLRCDGPWAQVLPVLLEHPGSGQWSNTHTGRNGVYLMGMVLSMLTFVHNSMDIYDPAIQLNLIIWNMEPVCRPHLLFAAQVLWKCSVAVRVTSDLSIPVLIIIETHITQWSLRAAAGIHRVYLGITS